MYLGQTFYIDNCIPTFVLIFYRKKHKLFNFLERFEEDFICGREGQVLKQKQKRNIVNNAKCDSRYILYQCTQRSVQMSKL